MQNCRFALLAVLAATGFITTTVLQLDKPMDFTMFYASGVILKQGNGSRLYDNDLQQSIIRSQVRMGENNPQDTLLRFIHPPFEAALFLPLAYLPYGTAFVVWECFNLICFGASLYLLRSYFAELTMWGRLALTAAMLFPVISTLAYGQDTMFVLLCSVVTFRLLPKRPVLAGCCLGLALIKFQFILVVLLVFALRRKWKVIAGALSIAALEVLISFVVVGRNAISSYVAMGRYASENINSMLMVGMPNLRGVLYAILSEWTGRSVTEVLALAASLLIIATVAIRGPRRDDLVLACGIGISPLVTFHSFCPDLLLMLLPAVLLAGQRKVVPLLLSLFLVDLAANTLGGYWGLSVVPSLLLVLLLVDGGPKQRGGGRYRRRLLRLRSWANGACEELHRAASRAGLRVLDAGTVSREARPPGGGP